jgi:hypothetical protein
MPSKDTQFKPGERRAGRAKGTPNKATKTVKETVLSVFNDLQEDPRHSLTAFAKKYPRDFYNIAAKLIPTEIKGTMDASLTWKEERTYEAPNQTDAGS